MLQNVRDAVPLGIEQIEMMLGLLAVDGRPLRSFLEVGCEHGLLASALLGEHREAKGVIVDASAKSLASVRSPLKPYLDQLELLSIDFTQDTWIDSLRGRAPFDAVVTAFATHALSEKAKRRIFAEFLSLLRPDGILIIFEHVSSATRWTESVWDDTMIQAIFGEELKEQPSLPRAEVAREYYERNAKQGATNAPLEVQCEWLREIGFESVECFLKVSELAMFGGQKPGASHK